MRDAKLWDRITTNTQVYDGGLPLHGSAVHINYMQGRDDLKVSNPNSGFRQPTSYGAAKASVEVGQFNYTNAGENWRAYGTSNPESPVNTIYWGMDTTVEPPRPIVEQNMRDRCLAEAIQKLNKSDLDLGVAFAELPKTMALLAETSTKVLKAYSLVKKGRYRDAASILALPLEEVHKNGHTGYYIPKRILDKHGPYGNARRDIYELGAAEAWLQLQYGWLPLLSDIHGVASSFINDWTNDTPILSVERNLSRESDLPSGGISKLKSDGSSIEECSVKLYYTIAQERVYYLNSLGLLNPLSVAWELVPFSFVLDWFVPIGSILQNFTGFVGLDYLGGYELTRRESNFSSTWERHHYWSQPLKGTVENCVVKNKSWYRQAYINPPFGGKVYSNVKFNPTKAITALALLKSGRDY